MVHLTATNKRTHWTFPVQELKYLLLFDLIYVLAFMISGGYFKPSFLPQACDEQGIKHESAFRRNHRASSIRKPDLS